jgi:cell division protein FtsI (penicillin-binding protein 3)
MSVIANGGLLYRPHVVQALPQPSGEQAIAQPPPTRVIQATTAATMRRMLEGVVLNGTGKLAQLDGYTTAGKTGTAQKIDPLTGRYSTSQYIASFVGFAPINNPAVTILVQLDSPEGASGHEGGGVAAPVFQRIASQVLAYLNVPRDVPLIARDAAPGSKDVSAADVSDSDPAQLEASEDSPSEEPAIVPAHPPSVSVKPASLTVKKDPPSQPPTAEFAEGDGIVVPSLEGKNVREVTEISLKLGFTPVLVGTGIVRDQEPDPGAMVRRGGSVTVHFGQPLPPAPVTKKKQVAANFSRSSP